MPISEIDGCSEGHWNDVQNIISTSILNAGYIPNLVSETSDVGVIQKRIVQNLYENPVVVCDISARNPNVMFELGMRLAFDKPVVIIKDDNTPYSFDTSPVEHLSYPRDLRFSTIQSFQKKLTDKIKSCATQTGDSSFLKSFGTFKVAAIDVEQAPADSIILEELAAIKNHIRRLDINIAGPGVTGDHNKFVGIHNSFPRQSKLGPYIFDDVNAAQEAALTASNLGFNFESSVVSAGEQGAAVLLKIDPKTPDSVRDKVDEYMNSCASNSKR